VVELRDVGLRGMNPPGARPRERGGRGRHDHWPTPGLVNLSVRRGELIALRGPAGSGKSALLHVIGLVDRPATGSYMLNGRDTARLGDRDRAMLRGRQIGLAFQRPHLLPVRTTLENVALPLRYAGWTRKLQIDVALAALDRVGLTDRAQVITAELSATERKLVAIARALATSPDLVLFDDPTTGLDEAAATRIVRLLISLHREGRTVFIATDDQFAISYSSQRIVLTRH
jgi:putative ABC transport system ATP-binding protein